MSINNTKLISAHFNHVCTSQHSHLGSCAFPEDLDSKGIVCILDFIKPLSGVSLRCIRECQLYRNLIARIGRVQDLENKET